MKRTHKVLVRNVCSVPGHMAPTWGIRRNCKGGMGLAADGSVYHSERVDRHIG